MHAGFRIESTLDARTTHDDFDVDCDGPTTTAPYDPADAWLIDRHAPTPTTTPLPTLVHGGTTYGIAELDARDPPPSVAALTTTESPKTRSRAALRPAVTDSL